MTSLSLWNKRWCAHVEFPFAFFQIRAQVVISQFSLTPPADRPELLPPLAEGRGRPRLHITQIFPPVLAGTKLQLLLNWAHFLGRPTYPRGWRSTWPTHPAPRTTSPGSSFGITICQFVTTVNKTCGEHQKSAEIAQAWHACMGEWLPWFPLL